jgi:hypothetical protein
VVIDSFGSTSRKFEVAKVSSHDCHHDLSFHEWPQFVVVGRDDEIVDLYDDDYNTAVSGTEDEYGEVL